jgi:hypothetical protein
MRECVDCADPATGTWAEPCGPDRVQILPVCYPCWYARQQAADNDEPPEPSGDPAGPRCDAIHRQEQAWQIKRGLR